MDFFTPHRAIKSPLCPDSRKNPFFDPPVEKWIVYCATREKKLFCESEVWCLSKAKATITQVNALYDPIVENILCNWWK